MSVKSAALCVSLLVASHPVAAQAQSASDVIERYIKAIGGKKAVEQIISTDVLGKVTSADGRSGVFTQRSKRPHLLAVSLTWGDAQWRAGFNGRSAWQDDGPDGARTLFGPAVSRVRAEATYVNARYLLSEKAMRIAVAGRDTVRGRDAIVVAAVTPDGARRTLFFDAATYLLVKDEQQTDAGAEQRFFDDYRAVDRVMEPHRIEWHRNDETFQITVERITHNTRVDEQAFDIPSTPSEPALDIDAVLSAAARVERPAEGLLTSYAYTMTSTSGRLDEQGRVSQELSTTYEVFHLADRAIAKVVKKNGEPLSDADRRLEEERVKNAVQGYEQGRSSGQASRREFEVRRPSGIIITAGVPLMTQDWFATYRRMADFSNIRRERLGSRPVIVVEFQPKPNAAPQSDFDRQARVTAGALWIDETSHHVMRIESYYRDDCERTAEGSAMRVERVLVNDEVWLPSRIESNFKLKFAFGNLPQWMSTTEYTDHKKFSVETSSSVTLPDAGR